MFSRLGTFFIAVVIFTRLWAPSFAPAQDARFQSQVPEIAASEIRGTPTSAPRNRSTWASIAGRRPSGSGGRKTTTPTF